MVTIRNFTATRKFPRSPATVEKSCALTATCASHHDLMARPPPPLSAYGISIEIYELGNGDHRRLYDTPTTLMATSQRFFHMTILAGRIFGNL